MTSRLQRDGPDGLMAETEEEDELPQELDLTPAGEDETEKLGESSAFKGKKEPPREAAGEETQLGGRDGTWCDTECAAPLAFSRFTPAVSLHL
ncbi:hypothetical protein SKAU_G00302880 [Synaphobranchus kaupii]|uniref:Uncharacterized protein n=1 Tax=Synaphobranchus kaupii TaxID=118154 RepID=A0A9Q1EW05_SYNKA|nr:hypothetical protein SKAU_G00302880 [Synaphobranchus kaupii]